MLSLHIPFTCSLTPRNQEHLILAEAVHMCERVTDNDGDGSVRRICGWFSEDQGRFFFTFVFSKDFFNISFLLLLYWGYTVTLTKFLTICHNWIHPLHHSPKEVLKKSCFVNSLNSLQDFDHIWMGFTMMTSIDRVPITAARHWKSVELEFKSKRRWGDTDSYCQHFLRAISLLIKNLIHSPLW
jgi:hypothetical protein